MMREKRNCNHLYIRVILECLHCGEQITNMNKVRATVAGHDLIETERYRQYEFPE